MNSQTEEKPGNSPALKDVEGSDVESIRQETSKQVEEETVYPKGMKLAAIMFSVWLSIFVVALVSIHILSSQMFSSLEKNLSFDFWDYRPCWSSERPHKLLKSNHRSGCMQTQPQLGITYKLTWRRIGLF
jgi:hypothetical protein